MEAARKVLTDLAKDREANFTEDTVTAKADFHRYLIGKGGSRINKVGSSVRSQGLFHSFHS